MTKILVKTKYGTHLILPYNLLKDTKPCILTATNKTQYFINILKEYYADTIDYTKLKYIENRQKIKLICPLHGEYSKHASCKIQEFSCPKCFELNGFRLSYWKNIKPLQSGVLYILQCRNDAEQFIKIGITTCNTIQERYPTTTSLPYNYKLIKILKSIDKDFIWNLEKRLLKITKPFAYKPLIKFSGATECRDIKSKADILKLLENEKLIS